MYETLVEIEALIDVAIENFELDFKHGAELDKLDGGTPDEKRDTKSSIAKDCSAFANSGGGTIIYGIKEKKTANGESTASAIAPVTSQKITRDRLTQIIAGGVEPPLSKFKINTVAIGQETIFVVIVERADTAHQSKSDRTYYHRVEATNVRMHDSEIRDVMNRKTSPLVVAKMDLRRTSVPDAESSRRVMLIPRLKNEGTLTAANWVLEILLPVTAAGRTRQSRNLVMDRPQDRNFPDHAIIEFNSDRTPLENTLRLLPGQTVTLDQTIGFPSPFLTVSEQNFGALRSAAPSVYWRLYVDNCRMVVSELPFATWCDN